MVIFEFERFCENLKNGWMDFLTRVLHLACFISRSRTPVSTKLSRRKIVSKRQILIVFSSHFIERLIIFRCIYYYYVKTKVENVFVIYFKTNIQIFLFLYILFAIHHSLRCWCLLFKAKCGSRKNFNFIVFEVFCWSLSWKYRFSQNVNHAKVQSKTKKYCKFHVDPTR